MDFHQKCIIDKYALLHDERSAIDAIGNEIKYGLLHKAIDEIKTERNYRVLLSNMRVSNCYFDEDAKEAQQDLYLDRMVYCKHCAFYGLKHYGECYNYGRKKRPQDYCSEGIYADHISEASEDLKGFLENG